MRKVVEGACKLTYSEIIAEKGPLFKIIQRIGISIEF